MAAAREFDAKPGLSAGTAERNRLEQLQAVQWISTYVRVLELVAFFGFAVTSEGLEFSHAPVSPLARALQVAPAMGFYFALILAHGLIRATLERKLRDVAVAGSESAGRAARAWTGTILMFASYFGSYQVASVGLRALAERLLGPVVAPRAIWVTFPLALLFGLGVVYWLSPVLVRVMFDCRRLGHPKSGDSGDATLAKILESCFQRAGLKAPTFWLLNMDRQKAHNAMVTGLKSGRGPFQPALFFTRSLVDELTPAEFEAVVLHEVSHLALRHMTRRLLWSVGALFFSFLGASVLLYLVSPWVVEDWRTAGAMVALGASFWAQMATLRWQVRKQELEADAHAVFKLGADLEALASALTKITRMNDHSMSKKDPSSYFNPASAHPTPDARIAALRARRDAESVPQPPLRIAA